MSDILYDRITQQYANMSRAQRKIADFLRESPSTFIKLSTHELEKQIGVSAATIVRFVQALGYSGMDEMRVYLARQIDYNKRSVELIIRPDDNAESLENKTIQLYRDATEQIKETLDFESLDQAITALSHAKTIYILGVGTSGLVAYDLYHRLNRYGKTTFYETDTHMNLEFSLQSDAQDALLALSYSGLTREVTLGAKAAQKRGTPVISITAHLNSPLGTASDIPLVIPETEHLARLAAISSRVHTMLVADILFSGIVRDLDSERVQREILVSNQLTAKLKDGEGSQK